MIIIKLIYEDQHVIQDPHLWLVCSWQGEKRQNKTRMHLGGFYFIALSICICKSIFSLTEERKKCDMILISALTKQVEKKIFIKIYLCHLMIHYITAKQTLSSKKKFINALVTFSTLHFFQLGSFTKWSENCSSHLLSVFLHSFLERSLIIQQQRATQWVCLLVCVFMCVRVCVTKRQILPVFAFGSILGAYFLLCTVVCLLSATSFQVTHAHNEQWNHTSTGCQAASKTLTDSAEMESDSNLARKTQAAGKHHFD